MKAFWDERYGQQEYIYGELPNEYFKDKLKDLTPAKALFPAEGEGRNAVYVAQSSWEVTAFDQSAEGRNKAMKLAGRAGVEIQYDVQKIEDAAYEEESFDLLVLIFAHVPESMRKIFHQKLARYLKKGGTLILEGFSKKHVQNQKDNPQAGGPRAVEMLYDLSELKEDFAGFEFVEAVETQTQLAEGEHHKGDADVIRILAIKK